MPSAARWVNERFYRALSELGRLHPKADPAAHGVEVISDLSYAPLGPRAESPAHRLDIYRPQHSSGPLPVVLYIHGGGFQMLTKDTHWIMGIGFARRDFVVVVVNYRIAPRYKFPAAVEDVAEAYRWTLAHARDFGGDPRRIVVAGESAGANLATTLTVMTTFERPEPYAQRVFDTGVTPVACLPACGILQVSDARRFSRRRPLPRAISGQIERCESAYLPAGEMGGENTDLANPLLVLESDTESARPIPPFFALVGTKDPLLDDTRRLSAALDRRGVEVEARYYPGGFHAFHAVPSLEIAREAWSDQFDFLRRVLEPGM